ncbi:MAG TPA: hypothetical protein ACFYEK_01335 [Candidatus Wunengus sp. YC60]|uniref:hypothetical protein n=1 Tax=Candidatus Wunengus sp. YC60 TaxID=3367697 RepID=UPI0040258319
MNEKNFMKMGEDNRKEGYLISEREVPGHGDNKPFKVFCIHTCKPDGSLDKKIEVVGDAVLLEKFGQVPFGSYIEVVYKGRVHKKAIKQAPGYHKDAPFTQTNSFHMWEVGVDQNAIPYSEVTKTAGATVASTPVDNTVANNNTVAPVESASEAFDEDTLPF